MNLRHPQFFTLNFSLLTSLSRPLLLLAMAWALAGCASSDKAGVVRSQVSFESAGDSGAPNLAYDLSLLVETLPQISVTNASVGMVLDRMEYGLSRAHSDEAVLNYVAITPEGYEYSLELRNVRVFELLRMLTEVSPAVLSIPCRNYYFLQSGGTHYLETRFVDVSDEFIKHLKIGPSHRRADMRKWFASHGIVMAPESVAILLVPERVIVLQNYSAEVRVAESVVRLVERGVVFPGGKPLAADVSVDRSLKRVIYPVDISSVPTNAPPRELAFLLDELPHIRVTDVDMHTVMTQARNAYASAYPQKPVFGFILAPGPREATLPTYTMDAKRIPLIKLIRWIADLQGRQVSIIGPHTIVVGQERERYPERRFLHVSTNTSKSMRADRHGTVDVEPWFALRGAIMQPNVASLHYVSNVKVAYACLNTELQWVKVSNTKSEIPIMEAIVTLANRGVTFSKAHRN